MLLMSSKTFAYFEVADIFFYSCWKSFFMWCFKCSSTETLNGDIINVSVLSIYSQFICYVWGIHNECIFLKQKKLQLNVSIFSITKNLTMNNVSYKVLKIHYFYFVLIDFYFSLPQIRTFKIVLLTLGEERAGYFTPCWFFPNDSETLKAVILAFCSI